MVEYNPSIRVLIVDDERPTRQAIRRLLEDDPDVEVVGETYGAETPAAIREQRPDLVTLDVSMPQMSGLEALAELSDEDHPMVIFVTEHEEYAPKAFDLRAVDYVLKPFADRRLQEAVDRAKERLRSRQTEAAQARLLRMLGMGGGAVHGDAAPSEDPVAWEESRLALRDGARILLLKQGEVVWIEAEGSYCRVHTVSGSELVRATLGSLERQLDARHFFRIHRSAVVGLDHLKEVSHDSHGDYVAVLNDGTKLRLARSRKEEFESRIGVT
jgi:two-component system LytT family response regulator